MIVDRVDFLNIDTLFEIVVESSINNYYSSLKFGRTLNELLNHMSITFQLSQVTMYEYLFLKKYSSIITDFSNRVVDNDVIKNTYPELYEKGIPTFLNFYNSVRDEIEKDYLEFFLPSGFITGNCVVTITGIELRNFLGFELGSFFKNASKGKCYNEESESYNIAYKDSIYEDEDFSNYIIENFLNGFYKYLLDESFFKSKDIISDSYNYKKFISNVSTDSIQLASIRNPYFNIDFINDKIEDITNIFNSYKDKVDSTFTFNNTYLEFNISSPLSVLFELYSILPKDRFISIESFGIPENNFYENSNRDNYECPEELLPSYENRFYGRFNSLLNSIEEVYSDNKYILKKLELSSNNSLYRYSILVSFSDISYILNDYLNIDNRNDLIKDKTDSSINNIIRLSKTIYNSLV